MIRINDERVCGIVNTLLRTIHEEGTAVYHMKLQKLLYFCYRDFLRDKDMIFFDEEFVAYPYAPVLESVYQGYQKFGVRLIDEAMTSDGKQFIYDYDTPEYDSIRKTLSRYLPYGDLQLAEITHKKGGAWDTVWCREGKGGKIGVREILHEKD